MSQPTKSPFPCILHHVEPWDTCLSKISAHVAKENAVTLTITIVQLFANMPQLNRAIIPSWCHEMAPGGETMDISEIFRGYKWHILIRIKADVIDSITLETCWFNPPRLSWRFNDTMPMQDYYRASVILTEATLRFNVHPCHSPLWSLEISSRQICNVPSRLYWSWGCAIHLWAIWTAT